MLCWSPLDDTSAGRRGTGDIEPNASNKANVMELMTGCVPLTLVTRARTALPSLASLVFFFFLSQCIKNTLISLV